MKDFIEGKHLGKFPVDVNESFRMLFDNSLDAILLSHPDGAIFNANPAACKMFGKSVQEIVGLGRNGLMDTSDPRLVPALEERNRTGRFMGELTGLRGDGSKFPLELASTIFKDANGDLISSIIIRDITDRKIAEEMLKKSETKLDLLFSQSLDGFFFMMLDEPIEWNDATDKESAIDYVFSHQRITKANDAILEQYRATRDQYFGLTPNDFFAHDLENGKAIWRQFFDAGKLHIETDERRLDGSQMFVEGDYTCLYDDSHRITGHFGIQRDITEKKLTEAKIHEKDIQFRKLSANVPDLIFQFTRRPDGSYCVPVASEGIINIFGCAPEDVIDNFTAISNVLHPDDAARVIDDIEYSANNLTYFTCEFRVCIPGKEVQWIYSKSTPERLADGSITWYGFNVNITERKKAEEELILSENKYRTHIEQTPLATIEYDKEFKFTSWNPAAERIFGYSASEVIGKHTSLIIPEREIPKVSQIIQRVLEEHTTTVNINENRTKSGEIITCEWYNSPLIASDGSVYGMAAFANDITERKRAEKAIKESETQLQQLNATKDKFFSIIAHDLKSPFNTIMGFSDILVDQVREKDYGGIEKYAEIIQHSSQRAMDLLSNLLEWSRTQIGRIQFNPEFIEIGKLISDISEQLIDSAERKSITIGRKIPRSVPVIADKAMISTVLRNFISNAVKFTNIGGEIVISAEQKSGEVIVSVKDNGIGIAKSDLDKLFRIDETYSTSGTMNEGGTGLGLILCKDFIEKHHGKVWVESEPNIGSTFYFSIPPV
jgi:PAS domain S-box-containing protein